MSLKNEPVSVEIESCAPSYEQGTPVGVPCLRCASGRGIVGRTDPRGSVRVGGCHVAPPPWQTIVLAQANHSRLTVPPLESRSHARVQDVYGSPSRYVRKYVRNVTNPHENAPQGVDNATCKFHKKTTIRLEK